MRYARRRYSGPTCESRGERLGLPPECSTAISGRDRRPNCATDAGPVIPIRARSSSRRRAAQHRSAPLPVGVAGVLGAAAVPALAAVLGLGRGAPRWAVELQRASARWDGHRARRAKDAGGGYSPLGVDMRHQFLYVGLVLAVLSVEGCSSTPEQGELFLTGSGNGSVAISRSVAGSACGAACTVTLASPGATSLSYAPDADLSLAAQPANGSVFVSWQITTYEDSPSGHTSATVTRTEPSVSLSAVGRQTDVIATFSNAQ